jgi:hypothetical protein
LPSYPALVTQRSRQVEVDFLDFIDLRISGRDEITVMEEAKTCLLRTMIGLLCDGGIPPSPSQPDKVVIPCSKSRVVMISPF